MKEHTTSYSIDLKHSDCSGVIPWCETAFGETDPYTPYFERRWVTFHRQLIIRDYSDYILARLKWG